MPSVSNGKLSLPVPIVAMMDKDFWKEWGEAQSSQARIEERLAFVSAALVRVEQAEREAAQRRADLDRQLTDMRARLAEIEGKGIAAWTPKRFGQLVAIISGLAVIFGAVFAVAQWLAAHWK